mmetsp:Transcript_1480/g.3088  ORF Transcript_1480/g.3088 Transcript_1480/m.3088 type:complete len:385 (-) Transcript_1480:100-1254(-)
MGIKQTIPTILLWCAVLSLCRTTCTAYTSIPARRISATTETFEFPSIRRNDFVQAKPHRRATTNWMKWNNDDNVMTSVFFAKEGAQNGCNRYEDWLFEDRKQRVALYTSLAILETIFWYWLAPGIDTQSRWFNPMDGELIATILNPATVFSPPEGSGLGFSSLLLNTFLILPMVWSLLLLQEQNDNSGRLSNSITAAIRSCACTCGFLVGGGILIPYMIFRRPAPLYPSVDPDTFPAPLKLFEEQNQNSAKPIPLMQSIGQSLLLGLVSVILFSFLLPFATHHSSWVVEWNAFVDRAKSSQFTALALYDFTMISVAVLDPMMDDALRRGHVSGWENYEEGALDRWRSEKRMNAVIALLPYVVVPLLGPIAWVCRRPRYTIDSSE